MERQDRGEQPPPPYCQRCDAPAPAGARYCAMCGRALAGHAPKYRRWLAAAPIALAALGLLGANQYLAISWRGTAAPTAVAMAASSPLPTSNPLPTSSPTPTLSPTPTAAPNLPATSVTFSRTLLEEAFEQAGHTLETGEAEGASYTLAGGAYVVTMSKPHYIAWSPISGRYADAAAQVDVTFEPAQRDTAAGILFRYQDDSNFYFFNISADGRYALDMLRNGAWSPVLDWTTSPQIRRPGETNRLRVEMIGDQISLYVNGALLDQASDTTFSSGRMALAVNTFAQGNAVVAFDNLLVQGAE